MFLILAWFCYRFIARAWVKEHTRAKIRAGLCTLAITAAIVVMALDHVLGRTPSHQLFLPKVPGFLLSQAM